MSQKTKTTETKKTPMRSRTFCLTSYDTSKYEQWKTLDLSEHNIKYFVYQLEKCPKTQKEHIQGYIEFKNQMRTYKSIKTILEEPKCHIESRKGTQDEARNYCMKSESQIKQPIELGTFTTQGRRTDIRQMYDLLKKGSTPNDIMEQYPTLYVKYYKAIDRVYNNLNQSREGKFRNVQVEVLYGEAGTSKTRQVYEKEGTENVYRLNQSNSQNLWFDGYTNQRVLLIDDYYGWIKYGTLLQLLDGYYMRLEKKGGFTYSNWTKIYITSNNHPKEWYKKGMTPALERRINFISEFVHKEDNQISKPIEKTYEVSSEGIVSEIPPIGHPDRDSCRTVLPTTYESKEQSDQDEAMNEVMSTRSTATQKKPKTKKTNKAKNNNSPKTEQFNKFFMQSFDITQEDLFSDSDSDSDLDSPKTIRTKNRA